MTNDPHATLDLEELAERPPHVAVTPEPALFAIAADVAGARRGIPDQWVAAARAELEPADLAALAPMGTPSGEFLPGCLAPRRPDESTGVADELERIATLPVEALLDDIDYICGGPPTAPWAAVATQPRRWLLRYARALGRIWKGTRGQWAAAAGPFEREAERVETATARGALPELMAGLHHRAHVRDGAWRVADPEALTLHAPEHGLPITPILGGPGVARAVYAEEGWLWTITYPIPGSAGVLTEGQLPPAGALEALLGAQRATILRLLDRPCNAGRVAEAIVATPGAATHHLRALESAGLVLRERSGRRVIVHRTTRGDALLDLYSGH